MYIEVEQDTGLTSVDGPFRAYQLITSGSTPTELLSNAFIVEVDEYGNDQECFRIDEYDERVWRRCAVIIAKHWVETVSEVA